MIPFARVKSIIPQKKREGKKKNGKNEKKIGKIFFSSIL